MFTGLVQDIGVIERIVQKERDVVMKISSALSPEDKKPGASICCSGCCLTVTGSQDNNFSVDISAETLSKTSLGDLKEGDRLNLEPSLRVGQEIGGHFVFGHIDGVARLVSMRRDGESWRLGIEPPGGFEHMIAPKGSVSLDGISLTVNEVEDNIFGVNIIPHTWRKTTLQYKKEGDSVNFEADMLARYAVKAVEGWK